MMFFFKMKKQKENENVLAVYLELLSVWMVNHCPGQVSSILQPPTGSRITLHQAPFIFH